MSRYSTPCALSERSSAFRSSSVAGRLVCSPMAALCRQRCHAARQALGLMLIGRLVSLEAVYALRDESGFGEAGDRFAEQRARDQRVSACARIDLRLPPIPNRLHSTCL